MHGQLLRARAELPGVRAGRNRHVVAQLARDLLGVEVAARAPRQAGERIYGGQRRGTRGRAVEQILLRLDARRVLAEVIVRVLAANFVQHPRREHPRVRTGPRVALLLDAATREPRRGRGRRTPFTRKIRHLPRVPDEERLIPRDLRVTTRERHVVVFGTLEDAVHVPVELRDAHDHVVVQIALQALGRLEEMDTVLDDRTADRPAVLMAAEIRLRLTCRLVERVDRVQRFVPIELEGLAMQAVGAALGRHRHGAAGRPAVLGRRLADEHLELLDRRSRKVLPRLTGIAFLVPHAVDEQARTVGERAGADVGVRLPRTHGVLTCAGHQQGEVHWLSGGLREHLHLGLRNDARYVALAHFDGGRFAGDSHRLLQPLHLHRHVARRLAADRDGDVGHGHDAEALQLGLQLVPPREQAGEPVAAIRLGGDVAHGAGVDVARGNGHAGKHASLRVADDAGDHAVGGLRHRRCRREGEHEKERRDENTSQHLSLR